jgi:hypothetical protein|tara:strand:- start:42 stop:278 length:237 start_codon:yes stop_codon:yes gene_type:complete
MNKKITINEWYEHEKKRREKYKNMGVIDYEEIRAKKMWNDPNSILLVKDKDLPCDTFTWDKELKTFVYTGSLNTGGHK